MTISRRQWLLSVAALSAAPTAKIQTLTNGPNHHFFGYYAVSPWNRRGDKMICLESTFQNRMPRPNEPATIVEVNPKTGATKPIAETRAWNLQQGCMLNWSPTEPDAILYNDATGGEIVSVACNLKNRETQDVQPRHRERRPQRPLCQLRHLWPPCPPPSRRWLRRRPRPQSHRQSS